MMQEIPLGTPPVSQVTEDGRSLLYVESQSQGTVAECTSSGFVRQPLLRVD